MRRGAVIATVILCVAGPARAKVVAALVDFLRRTKKIGVKTWLIRGFMVNGVELPEKVEQQLLGRKMDWTEPAPKVTEGCLAKYASMATSADTGAVLKW